jgi:hypothetical protein
MRLKFFSLFAVAPLALACAARAGAQVEQPPQDEAVRGAFITTRPGAVKDAKQETTNQTAATPATSKTDAVKSAGNTSSKRKGAGVKGGKSTQQIAHTNSPNANSKSNSNAAANSSAANGSSGATAGGDGHYNKADFKPGGIGLGYTLFLRDESGAAVRVNPKRDFKSGEAIRLLVESNTDGYLYIFDAENDATPQLIFPSAKLNRGDNRIGAHVPYEIPSSKEADETLRWFVFNDTPAIERVYVVVSRQPLADVPVGESLVRLCAESEQVCAWKPSAEQWASLKSANASDRVAVSQVRDEGRAQTVAERDAATRGLGLTASAPLPSVIYMVGSSNANVLVTTVDLIHK